MKENNTVTSALMKRANQVATTTDLLLARVQDWQQIKEYLCNRVTDESFLTEAQLEKLKRYQYFYNQLVSGKYTETEVVNQCIKMYKIKTAQAYEDLSCTKELFNYVLNINKVFEIKVQLEINRNMQRKCEELNDMKAAAAFEKNRALLLKLVPDQDDTPAELFDGHIYELTFDPELLGAQPIDMKELIDMINEKRNVKIKTDMFTELIDFEEIPTNADQEATSE
jgi:hypothetical protein